MPASVIDPHDGDDLTVASITTNVTDKIVAWETAHETGATTDGAVRHASDQIDDIALPELATPSNAAQTSALGVHARLDMFAVVLSGIMGSSGSGYAAKYAALASLTYNSLAAVSTALSTGASSAAGSLTLVRRASDGSANFSGTVGVVAISGTGNWATTGSVTAVDGIYSGVIRAGSGAHQITTTAGNLDATQLANALPAAAFPALTGDVATTAGSLATTVSTVGGKTAAQVASATTSVLAASSTGVGNHGAIAKYDVAGGMTFDGPVVAPSFTGVASSAAAVAAGAVGTAGLADFAVIGGGGAGSKVAVGQLGVTLANIADGVVVPHTGTDLFVTVIPFSRENSSRTRATISGVSPAFPALPSGGLQQYNLLYVDDTNSLGWKPGVPASSSPAKPVPDALTDAIAWIGPVTSTTTAITGPLIGDARRSPGFGGGGGGTGGGVDLTAKPFLIVGSDGTLTNETDFFTMAAGGYASGTLVNGKDIGNPIFHPKFSRYSANDAPFSDLNANVVTGGIVGSLQAGSSAGTLVINAPQPLVVALPGIVREISNGANANVPVIGTASGAAAQYNVIGDLSTGGPIAFTPRLQLTSVALSANETILAVVWWTGSAFDLANVYYPTFPLLNGTSYKPIIVPQQAYTVTAMSGGSYANLPMPGSTPYTVNLPLAGMRAVVWLSCNTQQTPTTNVDFFVGLFAASGAAIGGSMQFTAHAIKNVVGNPGNWYPYLVRYEVSGLAAGPYTMQPGYANGAASGSAVSADGVYMWAEFTR